MFSGQKKVTFMNSFFLELPGIINIGNITNYMAASSHKYSKTIDFVFTKKPNLNPLYMVTP